MLDALTVGQSLLVTARDRISPAPSLRLIYVTDSLSDVFRPSQPDDLSYLQNDLIPALKRHAISVQIHRIPPPSGAELSPEQEASLEGGAFALAQLKEEAGAVVTSGPPGPEMLTSVDSAAPKPRPKRSPHTAARTSLDLGPWLSIPVMIFTSVSTTKPSSGREFVAHRADAEGEEDPSAPRDPAAVAAAGAQGFETVKPQREYKPLAKLAEGDAADVVLPENRMSAFIYGVDQTRLEDPVIESMKFKPRVANGSVNEDRDWDKGLQFLGCAPRASVSRFL